MRFGKILTGYREAKGLSITQMADLTGISAYKLIDYENGLLPSVTDLKSMAHSLGMNIAEFVAGVGLKSDREVLLHLYDTAPEDVQKAMLEAARFLSSTGGEEE